MLLQDLGYFPVHVEGATCPLEGPGEVGSERLLVAGVVEGGEGHRCEVDQGLGEQAEPENGRLENISGRH